MCSLLNKEIPSVRESLESLMPKGKDEQADKKLFFVVCDKCGAKIFNHNGYIEAKGLFTFAVECPCGNGFNHKMLTATARKREMQKQMTDMLNPAMLKNLTKKLMGAGE